MHNLTRSSCDRQPRRFTDVAEPEPLGAWWWIKTTLATTAMIFVAGAVGGIAAAALGLPVCAAAIGSVWVLYLLS